MALTASNRPITKKSAPRISIDKASDHWGVIPDVSALSADPNLAEFAGKPPFCPQMLTLSSSAGGDIVMADENGESFTVSVPAGGVIVVTRPIKTIDESASGAVQVVMEWWAGSSTEVNP